MSVIVDRPATPWSTAGGAAMGSRWRAVVAAGPAGLGAWIGDEIGRLERSWSRFDPTSELRRAEADRDDPHRGDLAPAGDGHRARASSSPT